MQPLDTYQIVQQAITHTPSTKYNTALLGELFARYDADCMNLMLEITKFDDAFFNTHNNTLDDLTTVYNGLYKKIEHIALSNGVLSNQHLKEVSSFCNTQLKVVSLIRCKMQNNDTQYTKEEFTKILKEKVNSIIAESKQIIQARKDKDLQQTLNSKPFSTRSATQTIDLNNINYGKDAKNNTSNLDAINKSRKNELDFKLLDKRIATESTNNAKKFKSVDFSTR